MEKILIMTTCLQSLKFSNCKRITCQILVTVFALRLVDWVADGYMGNKTYKSGIPPRNVRLDPRGLFQGPDGPYIYNSESAKSSISHEENIKY